MKERAARDPAFAKAMFDEAAATPFNSEPNVTGRSYAIFCMVRKRLGVAIEVHAVEAT